MEKDSWIILLSLSLRSRFYFQYVISHVALHLSDFEIEKNKNRRRGQRAAGRRPAIPSTDDGGPPATPLHNKVSPNTASQGADRRSWPCPQRTGSRHHGFPAWWCSLRHAWSSRPAPLSRAAAISDPIGRWGRRAAAPPVATPTVEDDAVPPGYPRTPSSRLRLPCHPSAFTAHGRSASPQGLPARRRATATHARGLGARPPSGLRMAPSTASRRAPCSLEDPLTRTSAAGAPLAAGERCGGVWHASMCRSAGHGLRVCLVRIGIEKLGIFFPCLSPYLLVWPAFVRGHVHAAQRQWIKAVLATYFIL